MIYMALSPSGHLRLVQNSTQFHRNIYPECLYYLISTLIGHDKTGEQLTQSPLGQRGPQVKRRGPCFNSNSGFRAGDFTVGYSMNNVTYLSIKPSRTNVLPIRITPERAHRNPNARDERSG